MDKKYILFTLLILAIGIITFLIYKSQELKRTYEIMVQSELSRTAASDKNLLTEDDIKHLPALVQKYVRYTNSIGKEKVRNFKVTFEGDFRTSPKADWGKMTAVQYTDLINTTRLYFMQMKMFGIPVIGLHKYYDAKAIMKVQIAGLITVVDGKGPEMNIGETVTVFNDMCMLAPASLIDKRIEWQAIDSSTVGATFNNNGIKISAKLYFNEKGELINFNSENRYFSPTGSTYQNFKWSTPVNEYKDYHGIKISSGGEAVWSFPEGEFSYGRINIADIEYNVKK